MVIIDKDEADKETTLDDLEYIQMCKENFFGKVYVAKHKQI